MGGADIRCGVENWEAEVVGGINWPCEELVGADVGVGVA